MKTPQKISYISGNGDPKKASYISGNGTFQSTSGKFAILQEMKTPKKILIFSQKKAAPIFRKPETPKKFFTFQKTKLSYILERNFPSSKEAF